MRASRFIAILSAVASVVCGCCFHKELTESAQVKGSGTLEHSFRTTEQLHLIKDTHARILFLAEQDFPTSSRYKLVGVVETGTSLHVNRVERVTELIAILVFLPEYYSWDCTLAKIEDGHFAGKEVAVGGGVLSYEKDVATIGSGMLVSVEAMPNNQIGCKISSPAKSASRPRQCNPQKS